MSTKINRGWETAAFTVNKPELSAFSIEICGRDRWALECLIQAGEKGCTPIDTPGSRWSGYVFNLRQMGVVIETVNEPHHGPFAGSHARYLLRSQVTRTVDDGLAA